MRYIVFTGLFLVALGCGALEQEQKQSGQVVKEQPPTHPDPPIEMHAIKLWKAFSNEIGGNEQFGGKSVRVAGGVDYLRREGSGFVLGIGADSVEHPTAAIVCKIKPGHEKEFSAVKIRGANGVRLTGVCAGRRDVAGAYRGYIIVLENCTLAE